MMTAPTTAPMNPADWPGWYQPNAWPRKVATIAPTIPSSTVTMNPPGSRPGVSILATNPARPPMMMAPMNEIMGTLRPCVKIALRRAG